MGVARLLRVTTPYTEAEVGAVDYEQSADVMYLAHPSHVPGKLSRYSHIDWRFSDVVFGATIAAPGSPAATAHNPNTGTGYTPVTTDYCVTAIQSDNGQESLQSATATSGLNDLTLDGNYNTITWAAVTGAEFYNVYKKENGIFGYVGGTTDLTFKDDNIAPDLGLTPPQDRQPFTAENDHPGRVSFYQQRLVWARTNNKPNGIWASQSANFENLNVARPAKADDAITFALVARQVNAITALVPLKSFLAFTTDAIFAIDGGQQGFITPSALNVTPQSYRGSASVRPVVVDNIVFFCPAKGAGLRSLGYEFAVDGYRGNDLTVFAPHFFKGFEIVDAAWAETPTSTIWCVRSDGVLLALTWQAEQEVWGWSLCDTDGFVESCCVVTEAGEDRLYILVRRTIQDVQRRYVERLGSSFWEAGEDAVFLDSARAYSGDPVSAVRGLDHLEGKTVDALCDGNVVSGLTVVDGSVSFTSAFSKIIVGLPFRAWIKTLPPVLQTSSGSLVAVTKQTADIMVRVEKTRGVKFGPDETDSANLFEMKNRTDELIGDPIDLYSGDYLEKMPAGAWTTDPGVVLIQDYPLPMTILGVFPAMNVGG